MENFHGSTTLAAHTSGIFLSSQEQAFCKGVAQGQPPAMVAKAIGLSPIKKWIEWMERDDIVQTLAMLKGQVDKFMGVAVTRDLLNSMLFEAHATADCSTAKIASIRELGKMNGIYEPEKKEVINSVAAKIEHLETLTDAELLQRANLRDSLANPTTVQDAVFTDITSLPDEKEEGAGSD